MCSVLQQPLLPCSPFHCSARESSAGPPPPQNCSWTDSSSFNTYRPASSPRSAPTALQYQNQAPVKIRDPGTGSCYRLSLHPSFSAPSLLVPVSRICRFCSPLGQRSFEPTPHLFCRLCSHSLGGPALSDCPAPICPNFYFLVRAHRDFISPRQFFWGPPPASCHGSGGSSSAQVGGPHPALTCVRPSLGAACLQPGLESFLLNGPWTTLLEGPAPALPPAPSLAAPGWTPARPWTSLSPSHVRVVIGACHLPPALPIWLRPQGMAPHQEGHSHDRVVPATASAHLTEQPCWHEREDVGETAEVEIVRQFDKIASQPPVDSPSWG